MFWIREFFESTVATGKEMIGKYIPDKRTFERLINGNCSSELRHVTN